jgi:hypothetical protein
MAAPGGAGKAAQTVQDLMANPYVRRVIEDDAIRDNARVAYLSAREALDRAKGSDNIIDALFDDKRLQSHLAAAGRGIAGAREHLIVKQQKRRHWGRRLLIVVAGAALALALSEGLRNKVLDVLFGAEEEFDYVSTTAPPAPAASAPAPVEEVEVEVVAQATEADEAEAVEEDAGKAS